MKMLTVRVVSAAADGADGAARLPRPLRAGGVDAGRGPETDGVTARRKGANRCPERIDA
ncbi:hypothetical protein [Streptomyces sp. NPDC051567]|uniref:hypothetical protein n=1 Tax=Streptomyces sp. NPDC051567 TaxID=3365660 RepID=UPI0037A5571E